MIRFQIKKWNSGGEFKQLRIKKQELKNKVGVWWKNMEYLKNSRDTRKN